MDKKKVVHPGLDPSFVTGAYSDGVVMDGFLFVSGQASVDCKTSAFELGTIEEEKHRTMQNIRSVVEAAGGSLEDAVKRTVHLAGIREFDRYNGVYASYFTGIKPARTTVQSVRAEGIRIEIDCIVKIRPH